MRWPALLLVPLVVSCRTGGDASEPPGAPEEPAPPLVLDRTDLSVAGESLESASLGDAEFRELAVRALGDPPSLPAALGAGRLDVVGVLEPAPPAAEGEAAADARLIIEARIRARGHDEPVTAGVAALGRGEDRQALLALLEEALSDLMRGVRTQVELLGAEEERLVSALDSAEPDEQILAARLLARRGSRAAVPALGRMLIDPRPHVAESAAEALAAIGDQSAVPLLIGSIRRGDLRSEVRAIEAMGVIGGAEAEAYLEMTAIGHEIAEVRRVSEAALRRLRSSPR